MSSKVAETLTITYAPQNEAPRTVELQRPSKSSGKSFATRRDGRAIAQELINLAPGWTSDPSAVSITRTYVPQLHDGGQPTASSNLYGWTNKAIKPFERELKSVTHSNFLKQLRKRAVRKARPDAKRDWNARKLDSLTTWGVIRTRARAWNPIFSEHHILAAFGSTARGDLSWFLGLGMDNRDLRHELAPGRSVEEYKGEFSKILRRLQDTVLDAPDIVHGIGEPIVKIIEKHQRGLNGVALAALQAKYPKLREMVNAVITGESITSPDRARTKLTLIAYDAAEQRALHKRLGIKPGKQPQLPVSQPSTNESTSAETAGGNDTEGNNSINTNSLAAEALKEVKLNARRSIHRAFWAPSSVLATALDRRSERQDRIDIEFLDLIMNYTDPEELSLADQRYRLDLIQGFTEALTEERTGMEKKARKLSNGTDEAEQKLRDRIQAYLPREIAKIVNDELDKLKANQSSHTPDYQQAVKGLKYHEINDNYLGYLTALEPIAAKYSQDDSLSPSLQESWRQANRYCQYLLKLALHANSVIPDSRLISGIIPNTSL